MAKLIEGKTVSEAWSASASFLLRQANHRSEHLILAVESPLEETVGVRPVVDRLIPSTGITSVIERVADTIFPQDFYDPNEEGAADRLFDLRKAAREFEKESVPNGNYFDRMCEYPRNGGEFNQIAHVLKRLRGCRQNGQGNANQTEIGISEAGEEVRIQAPGQDRDIMGFPCLSHISVTLSRGRVHLAGTYRAQHFVEKAYGNLLGLGRLANFFATESGFEVGEVLCIATAALLGKSPGGMRVVREVIAETEGIIRRSIEN